MPIPEPMMCLIRGKAAQPAADAVKALAERVLAQHGESVQAIVFYGSCLRSGDDRGGMVDLYAVVDRYRSAYRSGVWALLNKLLPPNVFYLEISADGRVVRAKYSILSLADLERGVSPAWFHSYLWGRFAQPTALLYARSPEAAERVRAALGQAVVTFLSRVIPCLPAQFSVKDLWLKGLSLSYRAELRAERPEKVAGLFQASSDYYEEITEAALPVLPFPAHRVEGPACGYESRISSGRRTICRAGWKVRSLQGKVLSLLRLLKGAFTFAGGLDYILWKIERHTGVAVEVPPRLRQHPILALCVLSWRLYRKGAFR
jgi:Phosphatidate cytidylyltransferase, mitochondrial